MVYPDDIVAVQHTLDSGAFLHCLNTEASQNSPWRQSYLSLRGTEWRGWWEGGLTSLPSGSKWVDGALCDLRMLYVDTLPFESAHTETTTATPNPSQGSKFRLHVIHPLPDQKNQIHIQANIPTLIVIKALFAKTARSSWSAPVLQNEVPFLPSCPQEAALSSPDCENQEGWFSSVTLVSSLAGVQMLNVSTKDADSFQSVSVKVCVYEAVTGLSVEPHGCLRMLTDTSLVRTLKRSIHLSPSGLMTFP